MVLDNLHYNVMFESFYLLIGTLNESPYNPAELGNCVGESITRLSVLKKCEPEIAPNFQIEISAFSELLQ